jgi:ubiquinone/menaquinone biosynthesis C-methylase UbiE
MAAQGVKITDSKMRWAGVLEVPIISRVQRAILDGGRLGKLAAVLRTHGYEYETVLDVGCGLGEYSQLPHRLYTGIDDSFRRIRYACAHHPRETYVHGDAAKLPFSSRAFDLVMLIDTSHHLSDFAFRQVLGELSRVSRNYVVIGDPVIAERQNKISALFYGWDRGNSFRQVHQVQEILRTQQELALRNTILFRTFPGIYYRAIFTLHKEQHGGTGA